MIVMKAREDDQKEPWPGHPKPCAQATVQRPALQVTSFESRLLSGPFLSHL